MKLWRHKQLLASIWENLTLAALMECSTGRKDFACLLRCRCYNGSGPTVCPFCCTNCQQILTFASKMQASSPVWARAASALRSAHGVKLFRTLQYMLYTKHSRWRHHSVRTALLVCPKAIACRADLSFTPDIFFYLFFSPLANLRDAWADRREILHDGQY